MTESRKLRVFLCHSSHDKPVVRELYQWLLSVDWIDPWLDEEKLLPGQDWGLEIEKAAEAADAVIVCLSNRSITKEGYVQRELKFVLDIALEKPEGTIFIIPLRLDNVQPPRRLRSWQYVDYFPEDFRQQAYLRLQRSLELRLQQGGFIRTFDDIDIPEAFSEVKTDDSKKEKNSVYSESNVSHANRTVDQEARADSPSSPNPLSTISIETLGGVSTPIYYKGDAVPFKKNIVYSTATDNQTKVEIHLVLGENKLASDNVSLGKYIFDGIPPAKRGVPQIEINFKLDDNFLLAIVAVDKSTNRLEYLGSIDLKNYSAPPVNDPLPRKTEDSLSDSLSSVRGAPSDFNWDNYAGGYPGARENINKEDLESLFGDGDSGFSDFFKTIFGVKDNSSAPINPPKGYQQPLEISMEEAYNGATRLISNKDGQKQIRIPAGVRTGSKIRVAGEGPDGLDLYLIISVKPHPFFTRTNSDLFMHYPISTVLAYKGGELQVPVLEKVKSVILTIPPNTKDKQVFRLVNKGFPSVKEPKNFGHFYLTVDLYEPGKVSEEQKKLLNDIQYYVRKK